jgi:CRISPR-associated protein Csm2
MNYQKGRGPGTGGRANDGPRGGGRPAQTADIDLSRVRFTPPPGQAPDADLFANVAEHWARKVGLQDDGRQRNENKPSQLRKFYDELVMWAERVRTDPDKFAEFLPFIRMLNAKVAYAKGRRLVDANYEALMNHCLKEVTNPETLHLCKTFFEAFMGYYKVVRPSDK